MSETVYSPTKIMVETLRRRYGFSDEKAQQLVDAQNKTLIDAGYEIRRMGEPVSGVCVVCMGSGYTEHPISRMSQTCQGCQGRGR